MKQRHIKVPYALLDSNISNEAKFIYLALMYFRTGNNKQIKVSHAKISEVAFIGASQISRHITTLVKHKLLSRDQKNYGHGQYACNTYTILCDETKYAIVPHHIVFLAGLKAFEIIAYCTLKRFTDLEKKDFTCYMMKQDLAKHLRCSLNQVDKTKRRLKEVGLIEFERNSNHIMLSNEKNLQKQSESHNNNRESKFLYVIRKRIAQEKSIHLQTSAKDVP